jgi:hypothetical protein
MRLCNLCSGAIPLKIQVNGKVRNLQNRKYCLSCSPFGAHNTRTREKPTAASNPNAKFTRWQKKARRDRKLELIRLFGGRCRICGYSTPCPAAFTFHHVDPAQKIFEIGSIGLLRKWSELVAEAQKCVLLCCRCHTEFHSGLHRELEVEWQEEVRERREVQIG